MPHFAIPPPSEQCPVHDPRLGADVCHGGEVGLHESSEVGSSLLVGEFAVGESENCEYNCLPIEKSVMQKGAHRPS